jgi:hypothetical protein
LGVPALQNLNDRSRSIIDTERVKEKTSVTDNLWDGRGIGGDNRETSGHRLKRRQAESLIEGWKEKERALRVEMLKIIIGNVSERYRIPLHAVPSKRSIQPVDLIPRGYATGHDEEWSNHSTRPQLNSRLMDDPDKVSDILSLIVPADVQHDRPLVRNPQFGADRLGG